VTGDNIMKNIMTYAVLKGLRPEIRSYVLQKYAKTTAVVLSCGRIAEQVRPGAPAQTDAKQRGKQTRGSKRQIADLEAETVRQLSAMVQRMTATNVQPIDRGRKNKINLLIVLR